MIVIEMFCICIFCVILVFVNFFIVDGLKFKYLLYYFGKFENDLFVLVIDSFRYMYLFFYNVKIDLE